MAYTYSIHSLKICLVLSFVLLTSCAGTQASSTEKATPFPPAGAAAPPTHTSLPPTNTSLPPSQIPEPSPPKAGYAGKPFSGPLGSGSITFTVSADGLAIESGMKVVMNDVGCAEGGPVSGGYSTIDQEITTGQPIPIQGDQFHYGSLELNAFMPNSGMELIGQFDSDTSTSGTFGMDVGDLMTHCTLGPFEWTANAQ